MSDLIVTPAHVEARLRKLGGDLADAQDVLSAAEMGYATAKSSYEIESARARMWVRGRALERGSKMTVQEIEDTALLATADEYTALNAAEAIVRAARSKMNEVRTHIDIARSVGTSVRAAMDVA